MIAVSVLGFLTALCTLGTIANSVSTRRHAHRAQAAADRALAAAERAEAARRAASKEAP